MLGLVLGGALGAAAGPVDGAGVGEDFVELGGSVVDEGGAGRERGGLGVGSTPPGDVESGGGEKRGEVVDGVDVEGEPADKSAAGAELVGEGLDGVEIGPK